MLQRTLFISLLTTALTIVGFAEPPTPLKPDFSDTVVDRLAEGEVVLFQAGKAKGQAGAAVQIHATRDEVWDVLMDPEAAPSYMPTLREAHLLKSEGNTQLVEHEVKLGFLPAVKYQYLAKQTPKKTINFQQTEGDLRDFSGGWLLVDGADFGEKDTIFVFYQVYLDPGKLVPQGVVQRSLCKDLPPILTNVRQRIYDLQVENAAKVAALDTD